MNNHGWKVLHSLKRLIFLFGVVGLAACANEVIVHNLSEREANQILELLADAGINSSKMAVETGRDIKYSVTVASASRIDAIKILNLNEMPRRADTGYAEVFKDPGLIPTSAEERAKGLAALEGEIEKQLKLIDDVLDAQVQIVAPEESALRTTKDQEPSTTASVTVKYLPGPGGTKPLSEPQVQAIVAAGVEKLVPERVVVVMTPAGMSRKSAANDAKGTGLKSLGSKQLNMLAVGGMALLLLFGLGFIYGQVRLKAVRERLVKLQNEIAKARRKPSETTSPPTIPG